MPRSEIQQTRCTFPLAVFRSFLFSSSSSNYRRALFLILSHTTFLLGLKEVDTVLTPHFNDAKPFSPSAASQNNKEESCPIFQSMQHLFGAGPLLPLRCRLLSIVPNVFQTKCSTPRRKTLKNFSSPSPVVFPRFRRNVDVVSMAIVKSIPLTDTSAGPVVCQNVLLSVCKWN